MAGNHERIEAEEGEEIQAAGVERLLLLEKLLTKFEEDVEAGRVRITVGDLARILMLRDDAEEQAPGAIEVRWIEDDAEERPSGESDTNR